MDLAIAKNIVFSTFEGKATPMQTKMIEDWLAEEQNIELYFKWLEEWEKETPQFLPDTEVAYQRLHNTIKENKQISHSLRSKQIKPKGVFSKYFWLKIAACVATVVGLWLLKEPILFKKYQTSFGEISTVVLSDGSKVTLNANSTLTVPRFGFGKRTREVALQGEAEFSVVHTADHQQFLVKTPDKLVVEVLGTEFLVYARNKATKVALHSGKVQLHSLKENKPKTLAMKAGEVVTVDKKGAFQIKKVQRTETLAAWKAHLFVFDHTTLKEVAEHIEDVFGTQISITSRDLANKQITGTYQAQNANELLLAVVELLGVSMEKEKDRVIITENE